MLSNVLCQKLVPEAEIDAIAAAFLLLQLIIEGEEIG